MSLETLDVRARESMYDDLVGLEVFVPCSTWEKEEAVKCWGEDYAQVVARGVVEKVALHRKNKEPRFEISFPDKPFNNYFVGYDLDYIMSYCDEVPLKYHKMKADFIKKKTKQAELKMLEEISSGKKPLEESNSMKSSSSETERGYEMDNVVDSKLKPNELGATPKGNHSRISTKRKITMSAKKIKNK
jgi:hypothetical protein